jgi:acetoin utilization protein AcuC
VHLARAALIWDPALADYDLGPGHPLNPRRLTLTVELMAAYGIPEPGGIIVPRTASEQELMLVHSSGYIETVVEASDWGTGLHAGSGLGTEDNPIFPGMHRISALICGASIVALQEVLSGRRTRTFSIAGGLHHAHRSRAAGFCVYNDVAVAIAVARAARPDLRVLYVDIDAHHGDGVQEAFGGSPKVMTVSLHESGMYAFPGTGFPSEMGYDEGLGYAVNVPMPRLATDECYRLAFDRVVAPLARAFQPDVIVAQLGADAHHDDPLTELGMTLPGYRDIVDRIVGIADDLCEGRLVALGGGGYQIVTVVPLAWTWVMARLLGIELADEVPESWRGRVLAMLGTEAPRSLGATDEFELPGEQAASVLTQTEAVIREARGALFPLHGLTP